MQQIHRGQKRIGGDEYISHPVAVSNILGLGIFNRFPDRRFISRFAGRYGCRKEEILELSNAEVLEVVTLLTKEEGYDMNQYMIRIRANEMALVVKLADQSITLLVLFMRMKNLRKSILLKHRNIILTSLAGTAFEVPIKRALQDLIDSIANGKDVGSDTNI